MKKIIILTQEPYYYQDQNIYFNNKIFKTVLKGIQKNFEITQYIGKLRNKKRIKASFSIRLREEQISINKFNFVKKIYYLLTKKNDIVLIFSISPFTFYYSIILKLFYPKSKFFLYIQSDRKKEIEIKINQFFSFLFMISEKLIKSFSITIRASEYKYNENEILISPSVIENFWYFKQKENFKHNYIKLLYVGRIRKEKGIFSLISLLEMAKINVELTIIGNKEKIKFKSNFKIIDKGFIIKNEDLMNEYDINNITILPSFTESYSKVIDESLSRLRPVLIFKEIKHLSNHRKGIFVCERNPLSLKQTINEISSSFVEITKIIQQNQKIDETFFISKLNKILDI